MNLLWHPPKTPGTNCCWKCTQKFKGAASCCETPSTACGRSFWNQRNLATVRLSRSPGWTSTAANFLQSLLFLITSWETISQSTSITFFSIIVSSSRRDFGSHREQLSHMILPYIDAARDIVMDTGHLIALFVAILALVDALGNVIWIYFKRYVKILCCLR